MIGTVVVSEIGIEIEIGAVAVRRGMGCHNGDPECDVIENMCNLPPQCCNGMSPLMNEFAILFVAELIAEIGLGWGCGGDGHGG